MDESLLIRRRQLLDIYQAALRQVNGERAVSEHLSRQTLEGEWAVVAVGKAAAAMAMGAQRVLNGRIHSGLVITKYGHSDPRLAVSTWRVIESGHPLPDGNSLAAGEVLLDFLSELPEGVPLLFLLSGGASALVEALPVGMGLEELERLNKWLLGSGLPIKQMNAVRKRLSRIKGGRLAEHLKGRRCLQLLISDVHGDDPATIGSGPLVPAREAPLPGNLPDWLLELLEGSQPAPAPKADDSSSIESHIIASNALARQAAAKRAAEMGVPVVEHPGHFQGSAESLAAEFVETLRSASPTLYIWGGESSVKLPAEPGRGGRNQHLALAAARQIAGDEHCLFLAAGTDGTDGPTGEAGALVDGETLERGEQEGLSAETALKRADSGRFLEASGDLIETGPTGTNVMDLVMAWRWDDER